MNTAYKANLQLKDIFPGSFSLLENIFWVQNKNIAIAVSWWSDSMLLSFLVLTFFENKKRDTSKIHILHCNHKIRKESDDEEIFLSKFFKNYNFIVFHRPIWWETSESDLRERRYSQFNTYCQNNNIQYLFLGHNLTDRIETSFMNMIRWCWSEWFLNMKDFSFHPLLKNIQVIRPLLSYPKDKIEEVCKKFDIPYFEDRTNFDTSMSLRNEIRHNFIIPLSKIWKNENNFFDSWNTIYQEIICNKGNDHLIPLKICSYWNCSKAFERAISKNMVTEDSIASLFTQLGIQKTKGDILEIKKRFILWSTGFRTIGDWTFFIAHSRYYAFKTKQLFWEKELHLEKEVTEKWLQTFWDYILDISENLIWTTLTFPKIWDHYKWKLFTKWCLNQKIPPFWRNILPLAVKNKNIIFVFEPQHLIY